MRHHWGKIVLSIILLAIEDVVANAQQALPYVVYFSDSSCPVTCAMPPVAPASAAICCPATGCSPCSCCQRSQPDNSGSGSDNHPINNQPDGELDETNGDSNPVQMRRTSAAFALSRTVRAKSYTPMSISISGKWHSKFGTIDLSENGTSVIGIIHYKYGGTIDVQGRYEFGMLTLIYEHRSQPDIRGMVALHYDATAGYFSGESKNMTTGQEANWMLSR